MEKYMVSASPGQKGTHPTVISNDPGFHHLKKKACGRERRKTREAPKQMSHFRRNDTAVFEQMG